MLIRTLPLFLSLTLASFAKEAPLPAELSDYLLTPAPAPSVTLQKGDRLAICGDSITQQKMYSVLLETYLTACRPELGITCRQYGWGGERAGRFSTRMNKDVLRFKPTVATSCYGMNDFNYVPFNETHAANYRESLTGIAQKFKQAGTRYVIGSSGIIDTVPKSKKPLEYGKKDLNLALSKFRNIALEVAQAEGVGFADAYRPLLIADFEAKKKFGEGFKVSGKDGIHPGWAGHAIMAYAFLKALGVDGDLGAITYDEAGTATAAGGHKILSSAVGKISVRSTTLPFAPGPGPTDKDNSLRAGMALVPFDAELNRFILKIANPKAQNYKVTWGTGSMTFPAARMKEGINLAAEFPDNPLVAPFKAIQDAVAAKQAFEITQRTRLYGEQGKADLEGTYERTEKERAVFVEKLAATVQPADHTILIETTN